MAGVSQVVAPLDALDEARWLYYVSQNLFRVKTLLTCSICLGIFEKPTKLRDCIHIFCYDCIHTHLEYSLAKELRCPICNKRTQTAGLQSEKYLEKVGNVFSVMYGLIHGDLVTKAPSFESIMAKCKLKAVDKDKEQVLNKHQGQLSDITNSSFFKTKKVLVSAHNGVVSNENEPANAFAKDLSHNCAKHTPLSSKSKHPVSDIVDLFDLLKESPISNDKINRPLRTYAKRTAAVLKENKSSVKDDLLEFVDNSFKVNIVNWLNDCRNKFDLKPSTQENNVPELQSSEAFDMSSVSQKFVRKCKVIAKHVGNKNDIQQKAVESKKKGRRARSLETGLKVMLQSTTKKKRHSIAGCEKPNFVIEVFSSEEEVFKSDELKANRSKNSDSLPTRSKRKSDSAKLTSSMEQTNNKSSRDSSSGWARMKEIKKTIRKVERKPSKLRILTRSTAQNMVKKDAEPNNKQKKGEAIVLLDKIDKQKKIKQITRHNKTEKQKSVPIALGHKTEKEEKIKPIALYGKTKLQEKIKPIVTYDKSEKLKKIQPIASSYTTEKQKKTERIALSHTPEKEKEKIKPIVSYDKSEMQRKIESVVSCDETRKQKQIKPLAASSTTEKQEKIKPLILYDKSEIQGEIVLCDETEKQKKDIAPIVSHKIQKQKEIDPIVLLNKIDGGSSTNENVDANRKNLQQYDLETVESYFSKCLKELTNNESQILNKSSDAAAKNKSIEFKNDLNNGPDKYLLSDLKKTVSYRSTNKIEKISSPLINKQLEVFHVVKKFTKPDSNVTAHPQYPSFNDSKITQPIVPVESKSPPGNVKDKTIALDIIDKQSVANSKCESAAKLEKTQFTVTCVGLSLDESESKHKSKRKLFSYDDSIIIDGSKISSNLFDTQNACNCNKNEIVDKDDDDNDIFIKPTQMICLKENHDNLKNTTRSQDVLMNETKAEEQTPIMIIKKKIESLSNFINSVPHTENDSIVVSKLRGILNNIQRTLLNDSGRKLSLNCTTQTALIGNNINVAVQTDLSYDSPSGFKISNTNMFHTQSNSSVAVQTDCLVCPNCKDLIFRNNHLTTPNNKAAPLLNTHQYLLSASFDNIDYETQDLIKGKPIEFSTSIITSNVTSNAQSMNATKNCVDEKTANGAKLEKGPVPISIDCDMLPRVSKKSQTQRKFKRIRQPSSDSDSDDNVLLRNIKRNRFMQDDLSLHFASELQQEINPIGGEVEKAYNSEGSDDINYGEYLENVLKKFDEEASMVTKSPPIERPAKRSKTQDMIRECELIIKNACSGKIRLANTESCVDDLQLITTQDNHFSPVERERKMDTIRIDNVIESQVLNSEPFRKKVTSFHKTNETKNKLSESMFSSDNSLKTVPNKNNNTEFSDKFIKRDVNQTEKTAPNNKNVKPQLLSVGVLDDDLAMEFNESFGDAEIEAIFEKQRKDNIDKNVTSDNTAPKIKILQNIVIGSNNKIEMENNVSKGKLRTPTVYSLSGDEDEMFLSDSDVIQTTPEKKKSGLFEELSREGLLENNQINIPPLIEDSPDIIDSLDHSPMSCLNEVFIPPLEFQDVPEKTSPQNDNPEVETEVEEVYDKHLESLTPDLLPIQFSNHLHNLQRNQRFLTSTPCVRNSQLYSLGSLNLSPITARPAKRFSNPVLAAQHSKFSPLNIVADKVPSVVVTNPPKQQSILNFVRANDNLNTSSWTSQKSLQELTSPMKSKKPCVAYTRMTPQQITTITGLSDKKLINYSVNFNSGVTHLIVDVNENNCIKDYSLKYILAVAAGIWVLNFRWIEECCRRMKLVGEEPFEALDLSKIAGPRKSRLSKDTKRLLEGYLIHAAPPFVSITQSEVQSIIKFLGGEITSKPDDLMLLSSNNNSKIPLIITEVNGTPQDLDLYELWLETLKVITVELAWLYKSVGQYEKLSLLPFILCPGDSLSDLPYPAELLVEMPHNTINESMQ